MSEEKYKPVADEQTLAKLLEAAFVIQEHNCEAQRLKSGGGVKRNGQDGESRDLPVLNPPEPEPVSPAASSDNLSPLAKIVETQHQIQVRRLDFETALSLVAERMTDVSHARGAAIGILEGKNVRYRAVAGSSSPRTGSIVPRDKSMLAVCLKEGEVLRCSDVSTEASLDRNECQRRSIQSLIAVPVYHDGEIAGGLELYYGSPNAFTEQDVNTCQLMAGLVAEALVREEEATSKRSLAIERAAMLEALEKLQPNLAALVETPSAKGGSTIEPPIAQTAASCRKCGHQLMPEEQFCGQCGSPRASNYEPPNMQSKVASLWHMQEMRHKAVGSESPKNTNAKALEKPANVPVESALARSLEQQIPELFSSDDLEIHEDSGEIEIPVPMVVRETSPVEDEDLIGEITTENAASEDSPESSEALVKPAAPPADWSSAASARAFLEQLASSKRAGTLLRLWNTHRGDVYLAVAVLLVSGVIWWGLRSDHSTKATTAAPTSAATQRKPAPRDAGLSLFDRILIQLGLAEAPEPQEEKGNPAVQVWVDLHTALYYCPGADLYGKTPQGKFTTQRAAQLDQFEPAYRKVCN